MKKIILKFRVFSLVFYFLIFILSLIGLVFSQELSISAFGIEFYYDKVNALILFLTNFVLFLFIFNSKISLKPIRKMFYPFSVVMLSMFDLVILTNNLVFTLIFLFFMFLFYYFMEKSKSYLILDCSVLFFSFVLFSWGLIKYFALNDISITFINIEKYIDILDGMNPKLIFCGFLILIFRLFNFLPFKLPNKNSIVFSFYSVIYPVLGSVLLIKIYPVFNEYFDAFQNILVFYFLLNALYFSFVQFLSKSLIEFLKYSISANIAIACCALFLFNEYGLASFIYSVIAVVLVSSLGFLIADILKNKMGGYDFSLFKRLNCNEKLLKAFIFLAFLSMAKIPPSVSFFCAIYAFLNIFMLDFSNSFLNYIPYILFGCTFLLSLNSINMIYKILIEPVKVLKASVLKHSQCTALYLISFAIIGFGVSVKYVIQYIVSAVNMGNI